MKNNSEKEAGRPDDSDRNFTDAFDAPDQQGVLGTDNGPQHRSPPGEGIRAPFAAESDAPPQTSVFDGKGNESVVVVGTEEDDNTQVQGSGPDLASAQDEAAAGEEHPGSAFDHRK